MKNAQEAAAKKEAAAVRKAAKAAAMAANGSGKAGSSHQANGHVNGAAGDETEAAVTENCGKANGKRATLAIDRKSPKKQRT